jgi:hypothetical protein
MMHSILAAFFLQGGIAWMPSPPSPQSFGYTYWSYDINRVQNPYGSFEVGFDHDWGRWNVSLYGRHISSMEIGNDHGSDTLEFTVMVHPFR